MTTGISRGAAVRSYSAKPGLSCFCRSQMPVRSPGPATRALTGTVCRAYLDRGVRVGHQVVIPVRVGRSAALRAENGEALADRLVDERTYPLHAALRPRVVQEQEGAALERAADLAGVRAEFFDDLRVEVVRRCCHADKSRVSWSGAAGVAAACPVWGGVPILVRCWSCGRIANAATGISTRRPRTCSSARTNAPGAVTARRTSCTACARTAAASSSGARSAPLTCSPSTRPRLSGSSGQDVLSPPAR